MSGSIDLGKSPVVSSESYAYSPSYSQEAQEPQAQSYDRNTTVFYENSPKAPKRNPIVLILQGTFCTCGAIFLLIAIMFGISTLTIGDSFSDFDVDTSVYDANKYDIPFQRLYSVNGTATEAGFFLTLEASTVAEDLSKMRMCFRRSNATGVAQAIIPYTEYEYDGAFEIQECIGATALMQGGVGMCTTGDIYVAVYGDNEPFTLEVYYDYCHSDVEDCYCDYVGIYFLLLLVFLFSFGIVLVCICCSCCNTCCCCCLFGLVTFIDMANRSRPEARPLTYTDSQL